MIFDPSWNKNTLDDIDEVFQLEFLQIRCIL